MPVLERKKDLINSTQMEYEGLPFVIYGSDLLWPCWIQPASASTPPMRSCSLCLIRAIDRAFPTSFFQPKHCFASVFSITEALVVWRAGTFGRRLSHDGFRAFVIKYISQIS